MHQHSDAWTAWGEPRMTGAGPEHAHAHAIVEIQRAGEPTTQVIDPKIFDQAAGQKPENLLWRPMLWAREGAASRKFHETVSPDAVVYGLDGFIFLRFHSAFEQIFEGLGLNDAGADQWLTSLRNKYVWCAERGIECRFLVVPESMSVYNDKIPGAPAPSPHRPIRRILDMADPDIRSMIVYPHQALLAARARHATFSKDDVHFTSYGAFVTYRALLASLASMDQAKVVTEDQLVRTERDMVGGFGRLLGHPKYPMEVFSPPPVPHQTLLNDTRMGPGRTDVFETASGTGPSLVIFRTSNTTSLFPFLLHNFSRIVAVAGGRFLEDLIESERPAVVVTEIGERYISPGAAKPGYDQSRGLMEPAGTFTEYTGFPLPLPRRHPVAQAADD